MPLTMRPALAAAKLSLAAMPSPPAAISASPISAEAPLAEALTEHAAGQCDDTARQQIEAHQHPDLAIANMKIIHEKGSHRGDGLEPKSHGKPSEENNAEDEPAIAHRWRITRVQPYLLG